MNLPASIYYGKFGSRSGRPFAITPRIGTLIGAVAIALWATWPVLSIQLRGLPAFESMTLIFATAWLG